MIVKFDPAHCAGAKAHPSQCHEQHYLDDPAIFRDMWPETYSAFAGRELVAIGGLVPLYESSGGWVLFTDKIRPSNFMEIHRAVARRVATGAFAHIDPNNPQMMRWAELLDLKPQCSDMLPDGREVLRMVADV